MEMYMCKYIFLSTQCISLFRYVQKWLQWVSITKCTRQKETAQLTAKFEKRHNIFLIKRHQRLKIMALLQHTTSANIFSFRKLAICYISKCLWHKILDNEHLPGKVVEPPPPPPPPPLATVPPPLKSHSRQTVKEEREGGVMTSFILPFQEARN